MKALNNIKTFTIREEEFNLVVKELPKSMRGKTEPPGTKDRKVYISSKEKGKALLATLIDELIHCGLWDIDNDAVDELSDDMAEVLWKAGLRFVDPSPKSAKRLSNCRVDSNNI